METCIKLVGMFINIPDLKVARKQNIERDIYDRLCLEHLLILVLLDAHFLHTESEGHVYRFMMITGCETPPSEGINPLRHLSPGARRAWRNHWSVHDECEEWRTSRLLAKPASLDVIIYDHLWSFMASRYHEWWGNILIVQMIYCRPGMARYCTSSSTRMPWTWYNLPAWSYREAKPVFRK